MAETKRIAQASASVTLVWNTNDALKKTAKLLRHTYIYPQYSFGVPTKVPTTREISRF